VSRTGATGTSWVEQHDTASGRQLVVHLSGDDLRVLAAGVPVTVATAGGASPTGTDPDQAPGLEVLVPRGSQLNAPLALAG